MLPVHAGPRVWTARTVVNATRTTAAVDPGVQLVGNGRSASAIGGNRAGRAAALLCSAGGPEGGCGLTMGHHQPAFTASPRRFWTVSDSVSSSALSSGQ